MASDSLSLLPTSMAVPVYVAEEVAVGRCVFQNFMHEEFVGEGVSEEILNAVPEEVLEEEIVPDGGAGHFAPAVPPNYADENLAAALDHVGKDPLVLAMEIGIRIRECADAFAKSEQRKEVRKEAEKVRDDISYEGFRTLCDQVFLHGFNKTNIVALFCFCSDVVIKCIKEGKKEIGIRLFQWALRYVVEQVCAWVARHGGWEKAVKNTFSSGQIAAFGGVIVVVAAVGGYIIYKHIK